MVQLYLLSANLDAGLRRRVKQNGREYMLAPSTLIVPGVLNGSRGPLLYPPEENSKTAADWEGMPLVVYHPTDRNGRPVSASSKGIFEKSGIGHFRKPFVDNNGVLRGVSWFDLEKTKQVDPRVHDALINGKPIELSTGLYTENKPAAPGSQWQGRDYHSIATNYKPDHIAILPDQVGACSLTDGCGVHNTAKKDACPCEGECDECKEEATYNVAGEDCPHCGASLERDPSSGKCNSCGKDWPMTKPVENKEVETRVSMWRKLGELLGLNAGAMQYKCPETGKWLPYGAGTGKGEAHKAAMSGGSGLTGKELEGGVEKAAEDGGTESEVQLGSESNPDKGDDSGVDILNKDNPGEPEMNRTQVVNWLTTNCECWKGETETLNKMTDNQLKKLKVAADQSVEALAVVNSVKEIGGAELAVNAMPAFLKDKMAAGKKKPVAPAADAAEDEADGGADEELETNVGKGKRLTPEQFENIMPAEYLETWNASKGIVADATKVAVGKLRAIAANTSDKRKRQLIENKLKATPLKLSVLNELLVLTNEPVQAIVDNQGDDDYSGAAGGVPITNSDDILTNSDSGDQDDAILMVPTMNYDEEESPKKSKRRA